MSQFYDQASLVMVPSGYKSGKIYSQKPLSTSGELSFSRASNATRVNSSGLVEKVRTNELLYSNDFSNVNWGKSNATLTGGQSGYDGSTNGWKIEATATSCYISQGNYSVLRNHSIYAKAGTFNLISIIVGGYGQGVTFNLTNGTIVTNTNSSLYSPVITSVGSGWYRVSVGIQAAAPTYGMLIAPNNIVGGQISAGEYIYIQSAQTEYNDIATDYIATTSAAVSVGPVSGLPRLDYTPTLGQSGGGGCPSLLLEPQRTNYALYSEQFDNAWWTKTFVTLTANAATAPDGTISADNFAPTTDGTGNHRMYDFAGSSLQTATHSIFIKPNGHNYYALRESATTGASIGFNLSTQTVTVTYSTGGCTASNGKIETYANGWYRISGTFSFASATTQAFGLYAAAPTWTSGDVESVAWAGDGTSGAYIWGAQVEAGAYATSYIPTLSSAVTRVADSASKTGISSLIGAEGTFFAEYTADSFANSARIVTLSDGTLNTRITLFCDGSEKIHIYAATLAGGQQIDQATTIDFAGNHKVAFAYANNDLAVYVDGTQAITSSSFSVPACSNMYLGSVNIAGIPLSGGIKQSLLFTSRLSNADLATLTTL